MTLFAAFDDRDDEMTPQPPFKFEQFKFMPDAGVNGALLNSSARIWAFLGLTPVSLPVLFKKPPRFWRRAPTLAEAGAAIGFDDERSAQMLALHKRRLNLRALPAGLIYLLTCIILLAALIAFLVLVFVKFPRTLSAVDTLPGTVVTYVFMFVLMVLGIAMGVKLASTLVDRYFADSLCVLTIISLNLELSRDDVLTQPNRKMQILYRLHHLARNAQLLSLRFFSRDLESQRWVRSHFNHLARYIRERERWVIAPREATLADLRADFYQLARVFVSGEYGDFEWPSVDETEILPETWKQRFANALPRLLGFLVPLILMLLFILRPSYFERLAISTNTVALILIAWLLLAVDSVLKLGIVASLVTLAKGIKDLK